MNELEKYSVAQLIPHVHILPCRVLLLEKEDWTHFRFDELKGNSFGLQYRAAFTRERQELLIHCIDISLNSFSG